MKILITGGLGFIGINTANFFAKSGHDIYILDNLSRKGNIFNYDNLSKHKNVHFFIKDIKNYFDIENIFKQYKFDVVLHLAAQVAVTTSVVNPREDFDINCLGTFNLLECCRLYNNNCVFIYASTNKVYGDFKIDLIEETKRYKPAEEFNGISENQQIDFHSPYGCSKGCGDQYVIDYNRIFGLKTVALRQSCIYGSNQFGIEDQGWVSWFGIASIFNKPITIYGNGKQVRDVLYIEDLVNLYSSIISNIDSCCGKAYNIGGGPSNTLSLLELISLLEAKLDKTILYNFDKWRPGDQKIYISNIDNIYKDIGWVPLTNIQEGINKMLEWTKDNKNVFEQLNLI
jgi:CDP-paratose 2-epimerase